MRYPTATPTASPTTIYTAIIISSYPFTGRAARKRPGDNAPGLCHARTCIAIR